MTALVSAMSLNFFLTEPYLTLAITKVDDVVAFFALVGCGLIAAAFGRRRERLSEAAGRADRELGSLTRLLERTRGARAPAAMLQELRADFGLGGLVLRDDQGRVLAAVPDTAGALPPPRLALTGQMLFAPGDAMVRFGSKGMRLPEGGGPARAPDRPRARDPRPVGGRRGRFYRRREPDARHRGLDPGPRDAVRAGHPW